MQYPQLKQQSQSGPSASAPSTVRFGDFMLDLRAAELRKKGHKIRLQEQPFQILLELLERPGEVVLREEIRKKLWPDNTVVEFEHSINAAIKRLRDSLQDSAESPRYIETLARRGYRFIAPVSRRRHHLSRKLPLSPVPPRSLRKEQLAGRCGRMRQSPCCHSPTRAAVRITNISLTAWQKSS